MIVPDESRNVEHDNLRQESLYSLDTESEKRKNEIGQQSIHYYLILFSFYNSLPEFGILVAPATNHLGCNSIFKAD